MKKTALHIVGKKIKVPG